MATATPFLMFESRLEEALDLYTSVFPQARVIETGRSGEDGPILSAEFEIAGTRFQAYNGGDHFRFTDGFSILVTCDDQAEIDRYWDALVAAGSTPVQCGWITDPFGLSWQIVPKRFFELIADPTPGKAQAVMAAMMEMVRFDVAALERAHAEA